MRNLSPNSLVDYRVKREFWWIKGGRIPRDLLSTKQQKRPSHRMLAGRSLELGCRLNRARRIVRGLPSELIVCDDGFNDLFLVFGHEAELKPNIEVFRTQILFAVGDPYRHR